MEQLNLEERFIKSFDKKMHEQVRLNLLFIIVLILEIGLLLVFLPFLIHSALVAVVIAAIVLTVFSYGILKQFRETHKWAFFDDVLQEIKLQLQKSDAQGELSEISFNAPNNSLEKAHASAHVYCKIADKLYRREYCYYPLPSWLSFLSPWNEKLSCHLHWSDIQVFREKLLQEAVNEHLHMVRADPSNPDGHALLANAYVMLSGLYADPNTLATEDAEEWIPSRKYSASFQVKFKEAAQKAVEEFKILHEYAPKDPWVYTQLAYSYRDLRMPKEEKAAYESILGLCPNDHETRFKLGTLYFQQGENAKGLKIYDDLKKAQYYRADELLENYGRK